MESSQTDCPKFKSPFSGLPSFEMLTAAVVIFLATFLYRLIFQLLNILSVGGCRTLQRFHAAFRFNGLDLGQAAKVPLFLRLPGADECTRKFMREGLANHAATPHQHIHVIVL